MGGVQKYNLITKTIYNMNIKEILQAYKTITNIMKDEHLTMDNSFRRVQCWLSNKICDSLKDEDINIINK